MGQAVSRIYNSAKREVTMYNIENRARKVISKEKPNAAPKHISTLKELERLDEENVSKEYLFKKDEQLDEHLKKVYVTSNDPAPVKRIVNPERALPMARFTDDAMSLSYGYSESEEMKVTVGKVSLKQALQFIADHKSDPETHSKTTIAAQYKLTSTTTENILEHFKLLNVNIPKKDDAESLSTYEKLQEKIKSMTLLNANKIVKEVRAFDKYKSTEENKDVKEVKDLKNVNVSNDKQSDSDKNR